MDKEHSTPSKPPTVRTRTAFCICPKQTRKKRVLQVELYLSRHRENARYNLVVHSFTKRRIPDWLTRRTVKLLAEGIGLKVAITYQGPEKWVMIVHPSHTIRDIQYLATELNCTYDHKLKQLS